MEPTELFDICGTLALSAPTAETTRQLHEVLTLCAAKGSSSHGGTFGNLFAQIEFVCRTLGVSSTDTHDIQTARRHTNRFNPTLSHDEWLYDIRATVLLVSRVFSTDVPGQLLQHLPVTARPAQERLEINKEQVRCCVKSFDETTIFCTTDNGNIVVDYANTTDGRNLLYLRKILREGMLLNLLDCNVTQNADETVIIPRLIVVEPDFLIDISSLAACFTNYGHHPLLYTLKRLTPRSGTQAMLLGNFAGIALDCIINDPTTTTAAMLRRSFREQALQFCACPDFIASSFKLQAEQQVQNIREVVTALSAELSAADALLEPSFICESLGLQGRVDLMTSAIAGRSQLLVEQKSGRNYKIERSSHDPHGLQLENHYVQLLLYYGTLRYNFGRTARQTDIRLLYSRYPAAQGLVTVNFYQTLFAEAIALRNRIVATELLTARQGFSRIIPLLTADIIYKDVVRDGHFFDYVLPEVDGIVRALAELNPTERAYYEQMMTFIYREQLCQKLGNSNSRLHHSGGCAADLWQMPTAEKLSTGNIIDRLLITDKQRSAADGGFDMITLQTAHDAELPPMNFRRGDMVYMYRYTDTPDVRHSTLYRGTLADIGAASLTVKMTNGQQNAHIFDDETDGFWAIEHGDSDANANHQMRSLWNFVTADAHRRALLLGQREPQADATVSLATCHHPDYDDVLLRICQARDYFLLVGPPGTGKTSMALRFIVEENVANGNLLLTAYTNRAVDEICDMLDTAGFDFVRIGNEASCEKRFRNRLLSSRTGEQPRLDDIRSLISTTRIIVSTTSMLLAQPYIFRLKRFNMCVVDEASQILEPAIIGLLSIDEIERFVLIGDHKQLPAVVQQTADDAAVQSPLLLSAGITDCRQSLFERLLLWERRQHRTQFIGVLHRQGRMHPDVALFPTSEFYAQENIGDAGRPHQKESTLGYDVTPDDALDRLLQQQRMLFLPVRSAPGTMRPTQAEAELVADLLRRIHRFTADTFDAQKTVGVIVPYRAQIALIRQAISQLDIPALSDISIDTVERYQGSQRDVIIYSFAVSRRFQLDFLSATTFTDTDGRLIDRKLNVALTRARRQTIMVGDADVLRHNQLFNSLINRFGNGNHFTAAL